MYGANQQNFGGGGSYGGGESYGGGSNSYGQGYQAQNFGTSNNAYNQPKQVIRSNNTFGASPNSFAPGLSASNNNLNGSYSNLQINRPPVGTT